MYEHVLPLLATAVKVTAIAMGVYWALWCRDLMRGFRWVWAALAVLYILEVLCIRHELSEGRLPPDMSQITQPWHIVLCLGLMGVYAYVLCLVLWVIGFPIHGFMKRRRM